MIFRKKTEISKKEFETEVTKGNLIYKNKKKDQNYSLKPEKKTEKKKHNFSLKPKKKATTKEKKNHFFRKTLLGILAGASITAGTAMISYNIQIKDLHKQLINYQKDHRILQEKYNKSQR